MKLMPMVDFVLSQYNKNPFNHGDNTDMLKCIVNYANFLKQPLKLGMFVPCDEEGNVLKGKPLSPASDDEWDRWEKERPLFKQAKERVLFEGFKLYDEIGAIHNKKEYYIWFWSGGVTLNCIDGEWNEHIESLQDLIQYDLTLTNTAIKQING